MIHDLCCCFTSHIGISKINTINSRTFTKHVTMKNANKLIVEIIRNFKVSYYVSGHDDMVNLYQTVLLMLYSHSMIDSTCFCAPRVLNFTSVLFLLS